MRISIDTEVLKKRGLSLDGFLLLLSEYYNVNLIDTIDNLVSLGLAERSHYKSSLLVLSNNSRDLVARVLVESDERVRDSCIDFDTLAQKLQDIYPDGLKPGTTYSWRGDREEIAYKLRVLVTIHNFNFTEEEATQAVKEYLSSYSNTKYLQLLKYFILRTTDDGEINSLFMTIIENNRQKNENDN